MIHTDTKPNILGSLTSLGIKQVISEFRKESSDLTMIKIIVGRILAQYRMVVIQLMKHAFVPLAVTNQENRYAQPVQI